MEGVCGAKTHSLLDAIDNIKPYMSRTAKPLFLQTQSKTLHPVCVYTLAVWYHALG